MSFARLAALAILLCSSNAYADWQFGGYLGVSNTSGNTLTVTPTGGGNAQTVRVDSYEARPFKAPQYYGVRVGWLPHDVRGLGYEVEWNHAKAYGQGLSSGSDLTYFAQSHGLNFVLGNAVYRFAPACSGACAFNVRGGLGVSTPHVETTFRNLRQEQYQRAGFAWQVGTGIEYRLWNFAYAIADARITHASDHNLHAAGADIAGSFTTRHIDFGVALRP